LPDFGVPYSVAFVLNFGKVFQNPLVCLEILLLQPLWAGEQFFKHWVSLQEPILFLKKLIFSKSKQRKQRWQRAFEKTEIPQQPD